jgi:tRNA pseudouridine38-40 synthase
MHWSHSAAIMCWMFLRRRVTAASGFLSLRTHATAAGALWGLQKREEPAWTTALLRVSYDGFHFSGWSSANDDRSVEDEDGAPAPLPFRVSSGRRRRQTSNIAADPTRIRSVEGVLQRSLAKLYGNMDLDRVIVVGCSRTDKGVHALGMVAQIYAYAEPSENSDDAGENAVSSNTLSIPRTVLPHSVSLPQPSIPGKILPHPWHSLDPTPCFTPLPKPLPDLTLALNRMMYPEVQIMAYAAVPLVPQETQPFHPSISARSKTYRYTFSVGPMHDPTQWRTVWHLHNHSTWDIDAIFQAATVLQGCHNFAAFQGAPRGSCERRRRLNQNTTCTLESMEIRPKRNDLWNQRLATTYEVYITGDRFLYKMVRFLVGALVAVGTGRCSVADIELFLATGRRQGVTLECAPPHGLVLYSVQYDDSLLEWHGARS